MKPLQYIVECTRCTNLYANVFCRPTVSATTCHIVGYIYTTSLNLINIRLFAST